MNKRVICVLSGEIASGKSTLAKNLREYGFLHLRTRDLIENSMGEHSNNRGALQDQGDKLDDQGVEWIVEPLLKAATNEKSGVRIVLDAMRRVSQVQAIRDSVELSEFDIVHVHLQASAPVLRSRFEERGDQDDYNKVKANNTEANVNELEAHADLVIRTDRSTPLDVVARVLTRLGFRRNNDARLVDVIVGAQYGSEGKGHIVAHIASEYEVLVRVGGANAGHTVLHQGKKIIWKLLPSGSLHSPNATIVCGPGMNIDLPVLEHEIELIGGKDEAVRRLRIDPQANIVIASDKTEEGALVGNVGSTGQGVGKATSRRIMNRGTGEMLLARDVPQLAPYLARTRDVLDAAYAQGKRVLLEGTQGTGLSLYHGPYPYVTSRDTTVSGCMAEAGIPPSRVRKSILVVRTNPIRVQSPEGGTSGPMSQEVTWEEISKRAGEDPSVLRERERTSTTKRLRRVAEFDWSLLQMAISLNGPTDIALTFVDYINMENQDARRFEQLTDETIAFIREIEDAAGCPVSLITTRFHQRSIIDRRVW